MKIYISFLLMTVLACSPSEKECSYFRAGVFKYKDSKYNDWIVTRNDSVQIESNKKNNIKIIASIKWLSDCKYILTYIEFINKPQNNMIGTQIDVEIIKTSKESYKYYAKNNTHNSNKWMIKIK